MRKFEYLLSIPKTVFLNFKLFGMKTAIKCPIYIHYKTQLGIITRNSVKIDKIYPGVVRIGFEGTEGVKNCEGKGSEKMDISILKKMLIGDEMQQLE